MTETQNAAHAWRVLAISSFAVFAAALDTTVMFIAFPDIRRTFADVSAAQLSWVINAYIIVFAALLVPAGRIADRVGRKTVFFSGVVAFTLSSAAAGAAPMPEFLIGARVVQAIGGALLFPASLALVLAEFPRSKRATAVGVWGAVGALAAAAGPSFGGFIIESLSWRWAFYINLPIGALTIAAGHRVLVESRDSEAQRRPDLVGALVLMGAVGALALAIVQSDEWGWTDTRTLISFAVSAALLPLFLLRSATHHSPTLDLTLFRDQNYRLANVTSAIFGVGFAAMIFGLVLFLTDVWGYGVLISGLLITPGPLMAALVAAPAGRLADRVGHRPIMVPGGILFALGHGWMLLNAGPDRDILVTWLPSLVTTGIGVGLVLPALSSSAVHGLPPNRFAVGSAVNQTVRQIAAVLGVAILIAILGARHTQADVLDAFERVFALLIASGLGAAFVSTFIDTRPRTEAGSAVETAAATASGEPGR